MSWRHIATKDLHQSRRSAGIWLLAALSLLLYVGYAAAHTYFGTPSFGTFVSGLAGVTAMSLPVFGLLLGYKSIIHERKSGGIFLTLSGPQSRRELVLGTVVGRVVVLLVPTVVSLVLAGVLGAIRYGTQGVLFYPWFVFVTALYGVAFVALAVGLSMSTTIDRRITLSALGSFVLLGPFWGNVHRFGLLFLHRFDLSVLSDIPSWALLIRLWAPTESYYRLLAVTFEIDQAAQYVGGPLYVDWWMGLIVLLAWCSISIVLGFRRFESADL